MMVGSLEKLTLRLTQPSYTGVWAKLGNVHLLGKLDAYQMIKMSQPPPFLDFSIIRNNSYLGGSLDGISPPFMQSTQNTFTQLCEGPLIG